MAQRRAFETESIGVPVTWSPQEAAGVIQEAGIVGAGGAGFPTYVKYQNPQPTLLVNAAESEPGYYADKLLLRDHPDELVELFVLFRELFDMERFVIGAEDVAEPYMDRLEELEESTGVFEIDYFDAKYKYGQERALAKVVLGVEVPSDQLPQDQGVVVNNNETLLNVHRALFDDRPLTTKFMHVYGEGCGDQVGVYEAPIGTLAMDMLELHGVDLAEVEDCYLYDGGPILSERVEDPIGETPSYPVHPNTNAFLVVHPDKDRPRNAYYPDPDFEHNSIDVPWAADTIRNVVDDVDRVHVPRTPAFGEPAELVVQEGDPVEAGDVLGRPASGLSVGLHASIPGTVREITDEHVAIER